MYLLDADTLSFLFRRESGALGRFGQTAPEKIWVGSASAARSSWPSASFPRTTSTYPRSWRVAWRA
jgi:hypothetical protein